jgi:hypothetical protein
VLSAGSQAFLDKNAGTGNKTVRASGVTIKDSGNVDVSSNYVITYTDNTTSTINKANVSVTGLTASNKTYDTNMVATLTGTAAIVVLGSDAVTIGGTAAGTFADKHFGTAKAVTVTGNTISGTDAGNYNLIQQAGLTANISKADLSVTGLSASNKIYDTSTVATLTGNAAITALTGDAVTLGGAAVGAFADKSAANGKAVTVSGNTISGSDAGNYNLIQQAGLTANISKADLSVTGLTASNKTYDTSTVAALTGTAAVTALTSDTVTLGGTAAGAFADKHFGTAKAVTVTGVTLSSGGDNDNYNLIQQAGLTANISKADITAVTGITAANKVYDTLTTATLTTTGAGFTGKLGSDVLNVATATGNFSDKTAATGKTVNITGLTLGGTDAGNYNLVTTTASTTADISKANLTVIGLTAGNKTYDATTGATLMGTAAITALGSDVVTLGGTAVGAFADKNFGTGKAVTVTGNTINGTDAGNYNLLQQAGLTANISKADLTVMGLTASGKTYDGTTAATLSGTAAVTALVSDDVTLGGTAAGAFADKNFGTAKAVTITGSTISGTDAGNYTLLQQAGVTANISKADLTVTADNNAKVSGQPNPALTVTVIGFVNGETAGTADNYRGSGTASTTADASTPAGTAVISASAGTLAADNYIIAHLVDGVLTISAAPTAPTSSPSSSTPANDTAIANAQDQAARANSSPIVQPTADFSMPLLSAGQAPAALLPDSGFAPPLTIGSFNVVAMDSTGAPVTAGSVTPATPAASGQLVELSSSVNTSTSGGEFSPSMLALIQNAPPGLNMFVIDGGIRLPDVVREEQRQR